MKQQKAILIAFLLVQGVLPVWALVVPSHQIRTDFTWDMFAVRRDCSPCQLFYTIGDGEPERVSWGLRAPSLVVAPHPGFFSGLTVTPLERNQLEPRGFWDSLVNAPALDPRSVASRASFDDLGIGALLFYPSAGGNPGRFALNVRAAPQVARLKSHNRLTMIGERACSEIEDAFSTALDDGGDRWLVRQAQRWDSAGRRLTVHGLCECSYNGAEAVAVIEEGEDLCGAAR
jgi:hypothetical protein